MCHGKEKKKRRDEVEEREVCTSGEVRRPSALVLRHFTDERAKAAMCTRTNQSKRRQVGGPTALHSDANFPLRAVKHLVHHSLSRCPTAVDVREIIVYGTCGRQYPANPKGGKKDQSRESAPAARRHTACVTSALATSDASFTLALHIVHQRTLLSFRNIFPRL